MSDAAALPALPAVPAAVASDAAAVARAAGVLSSWRSDGLHQIIERFADVLAAGSDATFAIVGDEAAHRPSESPEPDRGDRCPVRAHDRDHGNVRKRVGIRAAGSPPHRHRRRLARDYDAVVLPSAAAEAARLAERTPLLTAAFLSREVEDGNCAARVQAFGDALRARRHASAPTLPAEMSPEAG